MANTFHIWPEGVHRSGEMREHRATLELPQGDRLALWFRVPGDCPYPTTDQADPFLIASIVGAMQWDAPVHVHGPVSHSLLANLEEYQTIWRTWAPDRRSIVCLNADEESEPARAPEPAAISCFSGGVDACFTVFRHAADKCGRWRKRLGACLMVHGFDVPLDEPNQFAAALANSRALLDDIGVPLVPMATNVRELPLKWFDSFATACVACMAFFQPAFRFGLIGSSNPYNHFHPHGSSPISDPFLSSDAFRVVHDGAGYARVDKVCLLEEWPDALLRLRVCWEGAARDRNCGRCEKCIRTILDFWANGLATPPCFDRQVTVEDIETLPPFTGPWVMEYQLILDRAVENHMDGVPWVEAVRRKLRRDRFRLLWPELRRRVALRTRIRQALGRQR